MTKVLYGRYSKGPGKTVTTTPSALAVNTYPTEAKSFELQGKSLVLNQQIYQIYNTIDPSLTGLTVTFNNGLLSVSGTADVTLSIKLLDNNDLVANHKYYLNAPAGSSTSGYRPYFATSGDNYTTDSIITWTTGKGSFNIRVNGGTSTGFSYYPKFIDLTQMFGPGLEPTTVDQLKSVLDLDKYIPYNPGTFIHNNSTYEVNKWNQLMQPNGYLSRTSTGITYVNNNDGTVTMSGTATGTDHITYINILTYWIAGHKYLIGTSSKYSNKLSGNNISQDFTGATLFTYSSSPIYVGINVVNGTSYSDTWSVNFIDLTDIFGAGKEPSTVDECKLRFLAMGIDVTKYQPYSPLGGQYCGYRNIWDEQWEIGGIHSSDGEKYDASDRIRSKNIIPCLPNTSYYFQKPGGTNKYGFVYFYDSSKVYISYTDHNTTGSYAFETPSNAYYMNFVVLTTTTYNKNDISIYQVSNKVDLGFNIWDEEWKVGHIVAGIETDDGTYRLISKNYIPVLPNTTYFLHCGISCGATIYTYDANKNYLQYISDSDATNVLFTTLSNSVYIKLQMYGAYGQTSTLTYNHDICISLSQPDTTKSPHNGDYRPYLMLRGIGSDFNVWDEEWEVGSINATTGELTDSTTMIRSKNKLPVLSSTAYYFQIPSASSTVVAIHAYNANGTWIGMYQPGGGWITSGGAYNLTTQTFTTPSSAAFLRFRLGTSYGTTYKNDICINLSQPQTTINPHNGQYVPRLFDTYDSMSGILTRRIGAVDLGTLSWTWDSTGYWQAPFSLAKLPSSSEIKGNILHPIYENRKASGFSATGSNGIALPATTVLRCKTTSNSERPSGMLLYGLTTPTVETTITQPISFVSGKLGKQYGVVDLGSLSWSYNTASTNPRFVSPGVIDLKNASRLLYCGRYQTVSWDTILGSNQIDKVIGHDTYNTTPFIGIIDKTYTDTTAFKNSLQGQYLIYELADSATNQTYATAGNLIRKTNGNVGDVDFNLVYNTLLNENKFLISYNMGTSQSPDKRLINVGGILNA